MERYQNNIVTLEEQRSQGLTRAVTNFVPAGPVHHNVPPLPINSQVAHVLDVSPTATQHVEMRTSAVDRAKGFLIASVPLYMAFAAAVVAVCVIGWRVPVWSLATFVIFWLSFVAAWIVGYAYTLHVSAEGVAHYEARQKWAILHEEQRRRWDHYEQLTKGSE